MLFLLFKACRVSLLHIFKSLFPVACTQNPRTRMLVLTVPDTVYRAQEITTLCLVLETCFLEELCSMGLEDKQKAKGLEIRKEHHSRAGELLRPDT